MTMERMDGSLDEEIAVVRAEIEALTRRRKLLTSSLLSTTKVQTQLDEVASDRSAAEGETGLLGDDFAPLLESRKLHSQINSHRLGFGVTSFPFHDPAPEMQSKNPLLGIRIDLCDRHGRFESPYYIFCLRDGHHTGQEVQLRIHRHTIPALVPLSQYESRYLPQAQPDEGYGGSEHSTQSTDGDAARTQDLLELIARVRHDLVSWRLRRDAISLVREQLALPEGETQDDDDDQDEDNDDDDDKGNLRSTFEADRFVGKFSVRSFDSIAVDARQARILWTDDRVGRILINDLGRIEKAVIIGVDGRVLDQERVLSENHPSISDLVDRLEMLDARK